MPRFYKERTWNLIEKFQLLVGLYVMWYRLSAKHEKSPNIHYRTDEQLLQLKSTAFRPIMEENYR